MSRLSPKVVLCNSFLYTNNIQKHYSVSRCVISIIIVIAPTQTLLFNLLIIAVLVLNNCFPFVGVCDIFRGGIISFKRAAEGPNRGKRR